MDDETSVRRRNGRWGMSGYWTAKRAGAVTLRKKSKLRRSTSVTDRAGLWRMSMEDALDDDVQGTRPNRNSEIRERDQFLELLCRVQDNRYESQRYTLKAGSSDGSYNDETSESVTVDGDALANCVALTNGATLPNGQLPHSVRIPSIEISPTDVASLAFGSELRPHDSEEGEGEEEGRGSLSPPPALLALSTVTPSRRSMAALQKLLMLDPPYPMVMEPPDRGYWIEHGNYQSAMGPDGIWSAPEISTEHYRLDVDPTAYVYGRYFMEKEHRNFMCRDSEGEPVLFSLKMEEDYMGTTSRMILRTPSETIHRAIPLSQIPDQVKEPEEFIRYLSSIAGGEIRVERAIRITHAKAPEMIRKFDEHTMSRHHKVGIIYQKFGQTSEEELFGNKEHSPALQEFLELLGDKIRMKGFKGYRGGLDVAGDQTGEYSVHTEFKDREVMFHVSTMLPHDPADSQHVQRKRHIGNDIVVVIFQDENTPFCPNMIRSHFVHSYIVVQVEHPNTDHTVYKVSVTAKNEVPNFGPPLPDPGVFQKCCDFRDWLLTKVLNAEFNCHQAPDFRKLATRTRCQLFKHLVEDLVQTMDDVDYNTGRKFSMQLEGLIGSPRQSRRRRTLASIFSKKDGPSFAAKRKSIAGTSPRNYRKALSVGREVMLGSTPDLSVSAIEEDPHDSPPSVRSLTLAEDETAGTIPETGGSPMKAKVKRKFTFNRKDKKAKRSNAEDHSSSLGDYSGRRNKHLSPKSGQRGKVDSSENSSVGSNWSIPCDLSLERGTSNESAVRPSRSQSNPTIHKQKCRETDITISGVRILQEGPLTADVATQVCFDYPPPLSPLSSKGDESSSFSLPTTPTKSRHFSEPKRRQHGVQEIHDRLAHGHSLSPTPVVFQVHRGSVQGQRERDGRLHHGSSTPLLDTYDGGAQELSTSTHRRTASSDGFSNIIGFDDDDNMQRGRMVFRAESTESVSSEVDDMYDSMLRSLQALTAEVSRLRQQNLTLCMENARFASQNRRVMRRYYDTKQHCSAAQAQVNTLQLKLRLYQPNFPQEDD